MFGFGEALGTFWLGGGAAVVDRPFQAPTFGRISHPPTIDPTLMVKPEGAPLRTLKASQAAYGKRLRS